MSKELIISVSPQETKAAILENEQVTEIYIERNKEHGIVGSICKGRVTKVLPGMQSAFVDIGLERDAFLYVSDFFEDTEEYDKIVSTAEEQVAKLEQAVKEPGPAGPEVPPAASEGGVLGPNVVKYHDRRGRSRRSRRNRLRGKKYDEVSPSELRPNFQENAVAQPTPKLQEFPSVLPGESLAKYQHRRTKSRFPRENHGGLHFFILRSRTVPFKDGSTIARCQWHNQFSGLSMKPKRRPLGFLRDALSRFLILYPRTWKPRN